MFYSDNILAKKGPLATIWLAAHWDKKLTKMQVNQTSIENSIGDLLGGKLPPMALRLSGQLLLGIAKIYWRKAKYLFDDCNETIFRIKVTFNSSNVDINGNGGQSSSITIPVTGKELNILLPEPDINLDLLLAQSQIIKEPTISTVLSHENTLNNGNQLLENRDDRTPLKLNSTFLGFNDEEADQFLKDFNIEITRKEKRERLSDVATIGIEIPNYPSKELLTNDMSIENSRERSTKTDIMDNYVEDVENLRNGINFEKDIMMEDAFGGGFEEIQPFQVQENQQDFLFSSPKISIQHKKNASSRIAKKSPLIDDEIELDPQSIQTMQESPSQMLLSFELLSNKESDHVKFDDFNLDNFLKENMISSLGKKLADLLEFDQASTPKSKMSKHSLKLDEKDIHENPLLLSPPVREQQEFNEEFGGGFGDFLPPQPHLAFEATEHIMQPNVTPSADTLPTIIISTETLLQDLIIQKQSKENLDFPVEISFSQLIGHSLPTTSNQSTVRSVVNTFLDVLVLASKGKLSVAQAVPFGEINIYIKNKIY